MQLKEIPYVSKLPKGPRALLRKYVLKKTLGMKLSPEEKEANLMLRFLARSKSSIERIGQDEVEWLIQLQETNLRAVTRRYPSSDLGILFQVLGKHEYQPAVEILKKKRANGRVRILDAGANVGFASIFFKAHFPEAEIISLEVDHANFLQLRKNVLENNLTHVESFEMPCG